MRYGRRIKFVIFSLLPVTTLVVCAEVGLRSSGLADSPIVSPQDPVEGAGVIQYDEDLQWSLRPGISLPCQGVTVTTNRHGLRSPEIAEKRPGECRILSLGESTTFGAYVEGNQNYSSRLPEMLNKRYNTDRFTVVNAGVSAYTSFQSLTYLKLRGLKLKPDVVLWYHELNDYLPTLIRDSHNNVLGMTMTDKQWYESRGQWLHKKLLSWSAIYRFVAFKSASRRLAEFSKDDARLEDLSPFSLAAEGSAADPRYPCRVSAAERREILDELVSVCQRSHIQLVLIHPTYRDVTVKDQCQLTRRSRGAKSADVRSLRCAASAGL